MDTAGRTSSLSESISRAVRQHIARSHFNIKSLQKNGFTQPVLRIEAFLEDDIDKGDENITVYSKCIASVRMTRSSVTTMSGS